MNFGFPVKSLCPSARIVKGFSFLNQEVVKHHLEIRTFQLSAYMSNHTDLMLSLYNSFPLGKFTLDTEIGRYLVWSEIYSSLD